MYKQGMHSDLARDITTILEKEKHYTLNQQTIKGINLDHYTILPNDYLPAGDYYELSFLQDNHVQDVLHDLLEKLMQDYDYPTILIACIGNRKFTCDAIGPRTFEKLQVTHTLDDSMKLENHSYDIMAIAPGVSVQTGMESAKLVELLVGDYGIDLVIVVDAIATSDYSKLGHVIQINNVGLQPGSGMGHRRIPFNKETLGCPVIAIGIPTVIYASSLFEDFFDLMKSYFASSLQPQAKLYVGKRACYQGKLDQVQSEALLGNVGTLDEESLHALFKEILEPVDGNYVLCDKGVDESVERLSTIVAGAMNQLRYK